MRLWVTTLPGRPTARFPLASKLYGAPLTRMMLFTMPTFVSVVNGACNRMPAPFPSLLARKMVLP